MADRMTLYKMQSQIESEIVSIQKKAEEKRFRSSTINDALSNLESKWQQYQLNHEKLINHGQNADEYFSRDSFEYVRELVLNTKKLIEDSKTQIEKAAKGQEQEKGSSGIEEAEKRQLPRKQEELEQLKKEVAALKLQRYREETLNENEEIDENKNAKLRSYRRLIDTLRNSLSFVEETSIQILERIREDWREQINYIRHRHNVLTSEFPSEIDVEEEYAEIKHEHQKYDDFIIKKISSLSMSKRSIELEKVRIPYFDGNIHEWASFHDLFKKFVDENIELAKVEKLLRLKTLLKGEAFKVIQHLPTTDKNYDGAWELINQRFGNKRVIFSGIIDKLFDQPNVDSNNIKEVKGLLDTTKESIQALNAMGIKLGDADPIIARIVLRKLDKEGLLQYEQSTKKSTEIQELDDVLQFLEHQYRALEAALGNKAGSQNKKIINSINTKSSMNEAKCLYCNSNGHTTYSCKRLLALTAGERVSWARSSSVCYNCLGHKTERRCFSKSRCLKCNKTHHTILHMDQRTYVNMSTSSEQKVLLATAQVRVKSSKGELMIFRALIDQGSQSTSISEEAAQMLQLNREKTNVTLHGLGDTIVGVAKSKVQLEIHPRFNSNNKFFTTALILPSLASTHLDQSFKYNGSDWREYILADPIFNKSGKIDLIIGADLYGEVMEEKICKKDKILGQNTKLGWILSGMIHVLPTTNKLVSAVTTNIERFWEIEEIEEDMEQLEDDYCMVKYAETTTVNNDGKFTVRLPFKEDVELGDSYRRAMARFISLEKRLHQNTYLRDEYTKFINEYMAMGHMERVILPKQGKYYLPHQAVVRESSLTTKVRVVFDASCKTTNGRSLNDILLVGPKLQNDIFNIIINWRCWRYVISADVEKMFRQIRVAEEDQSYQHILWRENRHEPIEEYKLTTVTYGTASAPFLAIRTLHEIGKNCNIPHISEIIKRDFYMDDLLTGADTIEDCKKIQYEISFQLEKFGFHLRKWISNNEEVINSINNKTKNEVIEIGENESIKTLGLHWNPQDDTFSFSIQQTNNQKITKRLVLSYLAKIFDPIGWLTPITVTAKLFIQHLWKINSAWDDPLDEDLKKQWVKFTQNLPSVATIKIPRWLQGTNNSEIQLLGFADASEKAYAAVIYLKANGKVTILAAKSKVNPMKNRKTLPKLELCAAHLLAKLINKVKNTFNQATEIFAWSDSMITLSWIKNANNKEKFIRTRVSEISFLAPGVKWGYVKSKENPADIGSRGIDPEKLNDCRLWWYGPDWLQNDKSTWSSEEPEGIFVAAASKSQQSYLLEVINKYSSYRKLKRVFAYIIRFTKKARGNKNLPNYLTTEELNEAENVIFRIHQSTEMHKEFSYLQRNQPVDHRSKIATLNPILDDHGIMRVGGRLELSNLPYNMKHPVILQKSHLGDIIIRDVHLSTLHGGNRLVESIIRRSYWIIGLKNSIKKCIHKCVTCIRYKRENQQQLMGLLPSYRVNVSQPFYHCGIDYAGPIQIKFSNGRGQKSFKGYIAVFICMATKAVHLEAVSSLSTDAFLAALKRFFARRGKSQHIYSDNGTNFVGAAKQLDKEFIAAIKNNSNIAPILEEEKIQWHFIPPASPHFGGVWEAAVKSMKYHLKRIIGENKLSFEELSTLLSQIEAILNSRPLHQLEASTEIGETLTPGHFLIGRPIIADPEKIEERLTCLDRWKLLQKLKSNFWKQWKLEYLSSLQQRYKWRKTFNNLEKGQVVIIKNEDTHPSRWPLARVVDIHPGRDGIIRVVSLQTQNGILKRPITKLCPLEHQTEVRDMPITDENQENIPQVNKENTPTVKEPRSTACRRNQPKKKCTSLMMLAILSFCMLLTAQASNTTEVRQIKENTAIYLDPINQINVVSSSWSLIIFYEMKPYFEVLTRASELLNRSKEICPKLDTFKPQCWSVIQNMEYQIDKLKSNNELILNNGQRKKREAPLKFIGSLYHVFFGLMDEDDRDYMEQNMKNLLANQEDIKGLAKKQTSLVDSTVNLLRRTTEEVNINFADMKERMDNISNTMRENHFVYRESIRFFMITKQLSELIDECSQIQKEAIDLLLDVNHGKIHPVLISPQQLQAEIKKIQDLLPDKLVLPGRSSGSELKEIWHLLAGSGTLLGSQLIVELKIPIFNRQSAQIYKIIAIPFKKDDLVLAAKIKAPYIVYNYELDSYHFLSQESFNVCKKTLSKQLVCEESIPWIDANTNNCEISPIKPQGKLNCPYKEVDKMPFWIELHSKGNWLFKLFQNSSVHIKCSDTDQTIMKLPQQGIISIKSGCSARIDEVILLSGHKFEGSRSNRFQSYLTKDYNPTDSVSKPLQKYIVDHRNELDALKQHIDELKKTDIHLRGLTFHHISGHTSLILVIIVIIILIILFVRKIIKVRAIAAISFPPRQNVQIT